MQHPGFDGETRLASAMQSADQAAWDFDRISGAFIFTKGLRRLFGYGVDDVFGLPEFMSATHPDDRLLWQELFSHRSAPPAETVHFRILRPQADLRWLVARIKADEISCTGLISDATDERRAANALAASEERLRFAIEAGRMAVWEVDMATGRLTNSPELNLLLGLPIDATPTLADVRKLYAPGELERLERDGVTYERVLERTQPGKETVRQEWGIPATDRTQIQAEFGLVTPAGDRKQLLLRAQHVPSVDGMGQRVTGVLVDITDRKLAEDRMALVVREMQHRVKNLLTVVSGMALQTFRPGVDIAEARDAFAGRVKALDTALDTVLKTSSDMASLQAIVERITAPHTAGNPGRFRVDGPPVHLVGRRATAIGMAIHELSTNALKYGALSSDAGEVSIAWHERDGELIFTWSESGGPPVETPSKPGFGTRLLRSLLPDGRVEVAYNSTGLYCELQFPLEEG